MPDKKKDYFKIQALSGSGAKIDLFGVVGDWDTDALAFKEKLSQIGDVKDIELHIHSPGGSVFEGIAIYNMLKAHPAQITVYIDGYAASMASFIAMVGDLVIMPENAMLMIHNPRGAFFGERKDLNRANEFLEKAEMAMATAYVEKSGLSEDEVLKIMDAETWYTGKEALEAGFVDSLEAPVEMAACADDVLARYKNTPEFLTPSAVKADTKLAKKEAQAMSEKTKTPTAEQDSVDPKAIAENARTEALAQEKQRRDSIKAAFGDLAAQHGDLLNACLDDTGTSVADAQSKLLNAIGKDVQPASSSFKVVTDEKDTMRAGFEQAILARAGLVADNPQNQYRGFTMVEMCRKSLEMSGKSVTGMSKLEMVGQVLAHSAGDFPNLLSNTANKAMLKGFEESEESFEGFTSAGSLPDFKETERVDLGVFPSLREVRPGAEYKQATIGDRGEKIQLGTYGEIFTISRQAIINDDLDAFTRMPRKMGMAAKRTIGDLVFAMITANPKMSDGKALFHADHKNLGSGALNTASVDALRQLMMKQKMGDATLNIRPAHLLVPVALEGLARQVMESEYEIGGDNNKTAPNYVRGMSDVISDARLDAASTSAFYAMANQAMYDTIEVAYLDGQKAPMIEQQDTWTVDGSQFKVRMDVGVKPMEFRTMAKSTGA
ncbi:MAG: Clp protease ClpP [Hydrogenovibrio sp.]|uniref:ClpP-like prohead protease/major capsid protein fusion protein n=1 Tax=Hydrogenovibrio sp. TaxID=2065821 RepID=UPI0028705BD0|nr:ClpP-like prohead protease/major capsid protein fusion protein [Hydrogenovibrio sp.]MDR9499965.1 Clp protease ClpP [Hydrogenovibrio sp.]